MSVATALPSRKNEGGLGAVPRTFLLAVVLSAGLCLPVYADESGQGSGENCGDGPNAGCSHETGEEDVCEEEQCEPCGGGGGHNPESQVIGDGGPRPVTLDSGRKRELIHDLTVRVTGKDYPITRFYQSTPPDENGDPISAYSGGRGTFLGMHDTGFGTHPGSDSNIGNNWALGDMRAITARQTYEGVDDPPDGECDYLIVHIHASITRPHRKAVVFTDLARPGGGNQTISGLTVDTSLFGSNNCNIAAVYPHTPDGEAVLREPGKWKQVFHESPGWISRYEDIYGNTRRYISDIEGATPTYGGNGGSVPNAVLLNGDTLEVSRIGTKDAEAWVWYRWDGNRVYRAEVYRPDSNGSDANGDGVKETLTQFVNYYYLDETNDKIRYWNTSTDQVADLSGVNPHGSGGSGFSDLGSDGDLVMVETGELVANGEFRRRISQYRYHDGRDGMTEGQEYTQGPDGTTDLKGQKYQVKLVISPQQIEYAAQQRSTDSTPGEATILEMAEEMLELPDFGTSTDKVFTEDSTDVFIIHLAQKVVSYEQNDDTERVTTQFLQAGDCGCSGGTYQGARYSYSYNDQWADAGEGGYTITIEQDIYNGSSFEDFRIVYYDLFNPTQAASHVTYIRNIAVEENTGGSPRTWVRHYDYDTNSRILTDMYYPSAVAAYTPASGATAPSVTLASTNGVGLRKSYEYDDDEYVAKTTISDANQSTGNTFVPVETTYMSGFGRRLNPIKIERFREEGSVLDNDIELTEYKANDYQFFDDGTLSVHTAEDDNAILYRIRTDERELNGENGPGGNAEATEIFDPNGNLVYVVHPDDSLTKYEYDTPGSGELLKVIRNAPLPMTAEKQSLGIESPVADPFPVTARVDDPLTTEYKVDLLGRVIEVFEPGDVSSYVVRELREDDDRPNLLYYAEVDLPHNLSASTPYEFDGPAVVSLYDASGSLTRRSEHELSTTATYSPSTDTYTLGSQELARTVIGHNLSGSVVKQRDWWYLTDPTGVSPYETEYEYDGMGRVTLMIDGNDTRTSRTYDVLDRVTAVKIGTTSGNEKTVAEYFYDGDPGAAPSQGTGDGNLTHVKLEPDDGTGGDERIYRYYYDLRNRRFATVLPELPWEVVEYDNLNRVVRRAIYNAYPSSGAPSQTEAEGEVPSTATADRGWYETNSYSQRGIMYRREVAINPSDTVGTIEYLNWNWWYDEEGNEVASWAPNSPAMVRELDELDRPTEVYLTDRDGNAFPVANLVDYNNWLSMTNDHVLEQTSYEYTDDDLVELVTTWRRTHDAGDGDTGALDSMASKAVATYTGYAYDDANRLKAVIEYGTNGTDFKTSTTAPSVPSSPTFSSLKADGDVLFEWLDYNTRGLIEDRRTVQDSSTEITMRTFYDDLSRVAAVVENASVVQTLGEEMDDDLEYDETEGRWVVSGLTADDEDRVTSYVYDSRGNVIRQVAHLPSGDIQETAYDYGVAAGAGTTDSRITSNNLLAAVRYPKESGTGEGEAGAAASEFEVTYAYNQLGELRALIDQNDTTRLLHRDNLGRVEHDIANSLGTDVDGAIRRIAISYDDLGRVDLVTSHSNTATGTDAIVNQVELAYTGLWQIETIKQEHEGAVTGSTPVVTYAYANAEPATGAAGNHSRVNEITYPSDSANSTFEIEYAAEYDVNDRISRVSGLDVYNLLIGSDSLEALSNYEYIGLGMLAFASVPGPGDGYQLDRFVKRDGSTTSGTYPGYDRFARLAEQRWVHSDFTTGTGGNPNKPEIFAETHSYDRASNRLTGYDDRHGAHLPNRDRDYAYDKLSRLTQEHRGENVGTPPGGTVVRHYGEEYDLDLLGNWNEVIADADDDDSFVDDHGLGYKDGRTHDFANQITDRTVFNAGINNLLHDFDYDKNGNITEFRSGTQAPLGGNELKGYVHVYDAWNRLVRTIYEDGDNTTDPENDAGDHLVAEYDYNGLHWRIAKRMDVSTGAHNGLDQERWFFYSASWQILEEWIDGTYTGGAFSENAKAQYFWGPRYIDELIAKRVDRTPASLLWTDSDTTQWFYVCDSIYSVRAVLDDEAMPYERIDYDAYGEAAHRWVGDIDGDGDNDANDVSMIPGTTPSIGDSGYIAEADIDFSGQINFDDITAWGALPTYTFAALPGGWISDPSSSSGPDNPIGYAGYRFNPEAGNYQVRFRTYMPNLGRWMQRDPAGYIDGNHLYKYAVSNPIRETDAFGLKPDDEWGEIPSMFGNKEEFDKFKRHIHKLKQPGDPDFSTEQLYQELKYYDMEGGIKDERAQRRLRPRLDKKLKGLGLLSAALAAFVAPDAVASELADRSSPCRHLVAHMHRATSRGLPCNPGYMQDKARECAKRLATSVHDSGGDLSNGTLSGGLFGSAEEIGDRFRKACEDHNCKLKNAAGGESSNDGTP